LLAQRVNFTPRLQRHPRCRAVQQLINGIGAFALLLSLVGIIIGGAMWWCRLAVVQLPPGRGGQAGHLYSVVGAVIVGAAAALVNWAFSLGQTA
jgi:hypothetical protein